MNEIKCPNCGEVFQVDESGYAQIAKQIRDKEFQKELERREAEILKQSESDTKIYRIEQEKRFDTAMSKKDSEIAELDRTISELRSQLAGTETEKNLAVSEAIQKKSEESNSEIDRIKTILSEKEREIDRLNSEINTFNTEKQLAVSEAVQKKNEENSSEMNKIRAVLSEKEREIDRLNSELNAFDTAKKLALSEAVQKKDRELSDKINEITKLQGQLVSSESEHKLKEQSLKDQYENQIRMKDEQIEYYKDFKARQSTKMIGESLEQHCLTQFNMIRMTAFPEAYFEKDNDARTGSKGDFIFRESAQDGTEFISIMFEMKNEADETATKHKNEDFFKELDKDRREKGCEYAVLVSMLEADNELYNTGIVDVSYRYEKMYVIRPQFFITMITLLRNAALNSLKYRQELQIVKNQQIDILHFEENMNVFKEGFARNYELAERKFNDAIDDIDRTIKALEKTKADLLSSERNLRLANDKAQDLSIKKLTKNAPSVRLMFDEIKEK